MGGSPWQALQLVASIVATSQGTPAAPASLPAGPARALPKLLALLPPPEPPEDAPREGVPLADGAVADGAVTAGVVVEEPAPEDAADSTPVELGAATAPEAMITCGSDPEPLQAQISVTISTSGVQARGFPRLDRRRC